MILNIVLLVVLIALNAFFVAAEFALVKVRSIRLAQMVEDGSYVTKLNKKMRLNLESYLAACQLGVTMASIALGWVGEPAFSVLLDPLFRVLDLNENVTHTVGFLVGFVIVSSIHLVIGEQVPKTIAIRKPERASIWLVIPLEMFYLMTKPLNRLLSITSSWILKKLGVEEVSYVEYMTGEELREMIDFSEEHGGIESGKAEMLTNLFEFDTRTAEQIMVPRGEIKMLDLQKSNEENIESMIEFSHSRMPLIDGDSDHVVGIILSKDLFNAALSGKKSPWLDLRSYVREPLLIPETMTVGKLFELMRQRQVHMAIVVDEYGSFAGLITLEDLLEEIVGEIADELDDAQPEYTIHPLEGSENTWSAHGLMTLTDLARAIKFEVPASLDANTLSGLIMNELQGIPKPGDTIQFSGYEIVVQEMKGNYVEKTLIKAQFSQKLSQSNDEAEKTADQPQQEPSESVLETQNK